MVEWGSLLRSCLSNPWTVGSNPTLSAIYRCTSIVDKLAIQLQKFYEKQLSAEKTTGSQPKLFNS